MATPLRLPPQQTVRHRVGTAIRLTPITSDEVVTGWSIRFRLYDTDGATIIATKTVGSGITILTTLTYRVDLTDGTSKNLTAGSRRYIIDRTDVGGEGVLAHGGWITYPIFP
jgi:hypothetical protein